MKITREYLRRIIKEELEESYDDPSYRDTPTEIPNVNKHNQIMSIIASLTMLASDSRMPTKNIERAIHFLERAARSVSK